jgi:tetratricopeptide (TPR) repeat protein
MLAKERESRYASMTEVGADLAALRRGEGRALPVRRAGPPTVAVMSFTNITRSREDDWLGMGIAETVSADLKGIAGLTLIGRERVHEVLRTLSDNAAEEALVPDLGRAVGAAYVVSGGYQRLGEAVRVIARLTDVESGAVLRTVKLDGPMSGIFELQDRIVGELAAGLRPDHTPESREADETHVVAAYEAFAKGLINLRAESADRAILFFERALALDPGYARAHLQLGKALDIKGNYLFVPDLLERAIASFHQALALRPQWAEAFREMGGTLVGLGRFDEALQAIDRALALDPENAGAHAAHARALFIGKARFADAAAAFERALRLNPEAGWYALQLAHCAALLRDYPRGEAAAHRAIELQEQFFSGAEGFLIVGAYVRLGHLEALQGRYPEAVAQFERELDFLRRVDHPLRERVLIELRQRLGSAQVRSGDTAAGHSTLAQAIQVFEQRLHMGTDDPFTRYYAAGAHAMRGELDAALDSLEKAAAVRRLYTIERARIDPDFDGLRGSQRFAALIADPSPGP